MFSIGILRNGPIVWKSPNYSNWDFLRANTEAQQIQKPLDGAIPAYAQESNSSYDVIGDGLIQTNDVAVGAAWEAGDIDTYTIANDCRIHSIILHNRNYGGQLVTFRLRLMILRANNPYFIVFLDGGGNSSNNGGVSMYYPMYDFPLKQGDVIEINYRRYIVNNTDSESGWHMNIKN